MSMPGHIQLPDPYQSHIGHVILAAANHHESIQSQLTTTEQFYANVADIYNQQQLELDKSDSNDTPSTALERRYHTQYKQYTQYHKNIQLQQCEHYIYMTRYQIENICNILQSLIKDKNDIVLNDTIPQTNTMNQSSDTESNNNKIQRNKLILLYQSKYTQYNSASHKLLYELQQLNNNCTVMNNFVTDLTQLNQYWSIRIRQHNTTSNTQSAVHVYYSINHIIGLQHIPIQSCVERGYINIYRDIDGHIYLDTMDTIYNTESLLQNNMLDSNIDGMSDDTSANDTGWLSCHKQLQIAQIGLLHRHIYTLLLYQSNQCTEIEELIQLNVFAQVNLHTITIRQPNFHEPITVTFPHSYRGWFELQHSMIDVVYSESIWLQCVQLILDYSYTAENNNAIQSIHSQPNILLYIINSIHYYVLQQNIFHTIKQLSQQYQQLRSTVLPTANNTDVNTMEYSMELYYSEIWLMKLDIINTVLRATYVLSMNSSSNNNKNQSIYQSPHYITIVSMDQLSSILAIVINQHSKR